MSTETTVPATPVQNFVIQPFYDQGGITIYNADCRKVLPWLERFDLLLTDPPYGIDESSRKQATRAGHGMANQRDYGQYEWDKEAPKRWLLDMVADSASESIVWGGNHFGMPPASCWLTLREFVPTTFSTSRKTCR